MLIPHKVRNICVFLFAFLLLSCLNGSPMNPLDETRLLLNLVDAVQIHAKASYNLSYGWSEIVECWTRKEIHDELLKEKITTTEKALEHFAFIAKIRTEHAQEIESTAW